MDWRSYKTQYLEYVHAIFGLQQLSNLTEIVLQDFPHRLPQDIQALFAKDLRAFATVAERLDRRTQPAAELNIALQSPVSQYYYALMAVRIKMGRDPSSDGGDFYEQILLSQNLVATVAYAEGFLNDSLRAAVDAKPSLLNRDFTITWEEALRFNDRSDAIEYFRDLIVAKEFGQGSLSKKASVLRKRLGVTIADNDALSARVALVETVRNLFVHNGGRIDGRFVNAHGSKYGEIGVAFVLDQDFLEDAVSACQTLASEVFRSVSQKHFGIPSQTIDLETVRFSAQPTKPPGARDEAAPPDRGLSD